MTLDENCTVICDNREMLSSWKEKAIVGRVSKGRLFPRDGEAFLDELPYMYKSPYCWAEPHTSIPRAE